MKSLMSVYSSKVSLDLYDPKTIEDRRTAAGDCAESLKYGVKTYVDEMHDPVNKAYAAWPTRLYLINKEGIVIYAGGLGPFGFKPSEFKQAVEEHLAEENLL